MIVYFLEKSKAYIKWLIITVTALFYLYFNFVFIRIVLRDRQTLQIIHSENTNFEQNLEKNITSDKVLPKGDYAFVSSKRGKYYYPISCSKSKTLSVQNMLYFKDKMSAESAGFKAYLGCF